MACRSLFPLILIALAHLGRTILITIPSEGGSYSVDPGPKTIEWEQQSGDPSECDIWLQKEGGNATYFAHVSVPSCRYDFSSWPATLESNVSLLETGEYCFTFTTTNSASEEGQFLNESAHFLIRESQGAEGLSTGAQAGIGIAVGAVGLSFVCLCYYMFVREGRRHGNVGLPQITYFKPELEDKQVSRLAHAPANFELPATNEKVPCAEAPEGDAIMYELPGTGDGTEHQEPKIRQPRTGFQTVPIANLRSRSNDYVHFSLHTADTVQRRKCSNNTARLWCSVLFENRQPIKHKSPGWPLGFDRFISTTICLREKVPNSFTLQTHRGLSSQQRRLFDYQFRMKIGGDISASTSTAGESSSEQSTQIRRPSPMDTPDTIGAMLERSETDESYRPPSVADDAEPSQVPSAVDQEPCTSHHENPITPAQIFCYSETGRLGQDIEIFRLREGNSRLVATFLLRGVGLNIAPENPRVAYTCVNGDTPHHHLVEVIRHRKIEQSTSYETRCFYCAMRDLLTPPNSARNIAFEYQVLPHLTTTGTLPRRLNYNLRLAAT